MNDAEFQALADIQQHSGSSVTSFVETYAKGKALIFDRDLRTVKHFSHLDDESMMAAFESQIWSYIIQEQLGDTLENVLFDREEAFSEPCTYKIGLQLLDQIQLIHESGYTYNDIKLDNVLIGYPGSVPNCKDHLYKIKIIDFGLASRYVADNGRHIIQMKEKVFQGNLVFASPHQFNLETHSRRNDMISLAYFLLYLIDGDLCFLRKDQDQDDGKNFNREEFQRLKELKNNLSPRELCESEEAINLLPFIEEAFSYSFDQVPNYAKLRKILQTCLKNIGCKFDKIYDWNEAYEMSKTSL